MSFSIAAFHFATSGSLILDVSMLELETRVRVCFINVYLRIVGLTES